MQQQVHKMVVYCTCQPPWVMSWNEITVQKIPCVEIVCCMYSPFFPKTWQKSRSNFVINRNVSCVYQKPINGFIIICTCTSSKLLSWLKTLVLISMLITPRRITEIIIHCHSSNLFIIILLKDLQADNLQWQPRDFFILFIIPVSVSFHKSSILC